MYLSFLCPLWGPPSLSIFVSFYATLMQLQNGELNHGLAVMYTCDNANPILFEQVYEHVYQTVDSGGSAELRATATAKATVAAFAASEGQGHPRIVEMEKVLVFLVD